MNNRPTNRPTQATW